MDYVEICAEEIALEGLDGITLSALWVRLENRSPKFGLELDPEAKAYLWTLVGGNSDLEFYELPEPRVKLVIFNRFNNVDKETGICLEPPALPEDPYPISVVSDKGVAGSCATYSTRKKVTPAVRDEDCNVMCTLREAETRWGDKLVIVASQKTRNTILFGLKKDPDITMPEKFFCVLERVARSRYLGELTHGKRSLMDVFKISSKTLFYIRKIIQRRHGLVTSQPFTQKLVSGGNSAGRLLHLNCFFVERKPIYMSLLENLTMRLNQKVQGRELLKVVRAEMNITEQTFKKLYQLGSKYVKSEMIPYRTMYPDAPEEDCYFTKERGKERFVRVLQLIKVFKYSVGGEEDEEEEDDYDDEDEDEDDFVEKQNLVQPDIKTKSTFSRGPYVREQTLMRQCYNYTKLQGSDGVTQVALAKTWHLTKLEARLICKYMHKLDLVKKMMKDEGRQRVQRFVAKKFAHKSELHLKFEEEKNKIMQFGLYKESATGEDDDQDTTNTTPQSSRSSTPVHTPKKKGKPNIPGGSTEGSTVPLYDDPNKVDTVEKHHRKKAHAHVTYRVLRRANIILQAVREAKLIDNILIIQKRIMEMEAEEGLRFKIDKKSMMRIIERLAREGQIKSIKTLIKFGESEKQLHFLCDPSVSVDDPLVQNAIEQAKCNHLTLTREARKKITTYRTGETKDQEDKINTDQNVATNYALLSSHIGCDEMEYSKEAGRRYGFLPRMQRIRMVHELLWYLVYGYGQEMDQPGGGIIDSVCTASTDPVAMMQNQPEDAVLAQVKEVKQPKVYRDDLTWRRFIHPLPKHRGYPEGWCLIGDVLLALPLSIFTQIIRVNFVLKDVEEYLRHPVKRSLLVSQLPSLMRQRLFFDRRYIFSFHEVCDWLCQMGLISFGRREFKDKTQLFVYVHKNCSIMNTTDLTLPLEDRTVKTYHLDTYENLRLFWFDLQLTCLNTPIPLGQCKGRASQMEDDELSTEENQYISKKTVRPDRFKECMMGKSIDEIVDDGTIPGDSKGAGGLDSSFWAHLKRNWTWNPVDVKVESLLDKERKSKQHRPKSKAVKRKAVTVTKTEAKKMEQSPVKKASSPKKSAAGSQVQHLLAKSTSMKEKKGKSRETKLQPEIVIGKPNRGGKGIKRKAPSDVSVPLKKLKPAKPVKRTYQSTYDDIDRQALGRMVKERVEWTSQEDSMLLLCQVTSEFLYESRRHSMLVPWQCVRDILHETFPVISANKTSKACQRRLKYMMKNPQTALNVQMFLGETRQDKPLFKEFKKGKRYIITQVRDNIRVYGALLKKLVEKFRSPLESSKVVELPDSLDELHRHYTISHSEPPERMSRHSDVETEKDIYFSVLHNLIHSALSLHDKMGRVYELYRLFSQYPEELLQAVFNNMKDDGIITKIKFGSEKKDKTPIPVYSMGTYQIAQRYEFNFISRYPKSIFQMGYRKVREMMDMTSDPTGVTSVNLTEPNEAGTAVVAVALMAKKQIKFDTTVPEQIIQVLSTTAEKKTEGKKEKTEKKGKSGTPKTLSDEEEEALIEEAEQKQPSGPLTGGDTGQAENLEKPQEVEEPAAEREAEEAGSKQDSAMIFEFQSTRLPPSRAMLSITRSQYLNSISMRGLNPQDNLMVKACSVHGSIKHSSLSPLAEEPLDKNHPRAEVEAFLTQWNCQHPLLHSSTCQYLLGALRQLQPPHIDFEQFLLHCQQAWNFTSGDLDTLKDMMPKISTRKSRGMTYSQILETFSCVEDLPRYLNALLDQRVVLRVGVTVPRFVAHEHLRPWLIYSYKNVKGRGVQKVDADESGDVIDIVSQTAAAKKETMPHESQPGGPSKSTPQASTPCGSNQTTDSQQASTDEAPSGGQLVTTLPARETEAPIKFPVLACPVPQKKDSSSVSIGSPAGPSTKDDFSQAPQGDKNEPTLLQGKSHEESIAETLISGGKKILEVHEAEGEEASQGEAVSEQGEALSVETGGVELDFQSKAPSDVVQVAESPMISVLKPMHSKAGTSQTSSLVQQQQASLQFTDKPHTGTHIAARTVVEGTSSVMSDQPSKLTALLKSPPAVLKTSEHKGVVKRASSVSTKLQAGTGIVQTQKGNLESRPGISLIKPSLVSAAIDPTRSSPAGAIPSSQLTPKVQQESPGKGADSAAKVVSVSGLQAESKPDVQQLKTSGSPRMLSSGSVSGRSLMLSPTAATKQIAPVGLPGQKSQSPGTQRSIILRGASLVPSQVIHQVRSPNTLPVGAPGVPQGPRTQSLVASQEPPPRSFAVSLLSGARSPTTGQTPGVEIPRNSLVIGPRSPGLSKVARPTIPAAVKMAIPGIKTGVQLSGPSEPATSEGSKGLVHQGSKGLVHTAGKAQLAMVQPQSAPAASLPQSNLPAKQHSVRQPVPSETIGMKPAGITLLTQAPQQQGLQTQQLKIQYPTGQQATALLGTVGNLSQPRSQTLTTQTASAQQSHALPAGRSQLRMQTPASGGTTELPAGVEEALRLALPQLSAGGAALQPVQVVKISNLPGSGGTRVIQVVSPGQASQPSKPLDTGNATATALGARKVNILKSGMIGTLQPQTTLPGPGSGSPGHVVSATNLSTSVPQPGTKLILQPAQSTVTSPAQQITTVSTLAQPSHPMTTLRMPSATATYSSKVTPACASTAAQAVGASVVTAQLSHSATIAAAQLGSVVTVSSAQSVSPGVLQAAQTASKPVSISGSQSSADVGEPSSETHGTHHVPKTSAVHSGGAPEGSVVQVGLSAGAPREDRTAARNPEAPVRGSPDSQPLRKQVNQPQQASAAKETDPAMTAVLQQIISTAMKVTTTPTPSMVQSAAKGETTASASAVLTAAKGGTATMAGTRKAQAVGSVTRGTAGRQTSAIPSMPASTGRTGSVQPIATLRMPRLSNVPGGGPFRLVLPPGMQLPMLGKNIQCQIMTQEDAKKAGLIIPTTIPQTIQASSTTTTRLSQVMAATVAQAGSSTVAPTSSTQPSTSRGGSSSGVTQTRTDIKSCDTKTEAVSPDPDTMDCLQTDGTADVMDTGTSLETEVCSLPVDHQVHGIDDPVQDEHLVEEHQVEGASDLVEGDNTLGVFQVDGAGDLKGDEEMLEVYQVDGTGDPKETQRNTSAAESNDTSGQETPPEGTTVTIAGQDGSHKEEELQMETDAGPSVKQRESTDAQDAKARPSEELKPHTANVPAGSPQQLKQRRKKAKPIINPGPSGTYQRVRLVCRPWKTPEGTVNRPALHMMVQAVLMFLMSKPGSTQKAVFDKYNPILQPVAVLELLEMLETMGCITKSYIRSSPRPSLFSKPAAFSYTPEYTGEETVVYRPTVDCIIKMGHFITQLKPAGSSR